MKKLLFAALVCVCPGSLPAQSLRVVNAASLSASSLAPGSIFTVFGTRLTAGVNSAADVQHPPTSLGGVTVAIGGSAASLFYTSPTQINGVVNAATPTGSRTLTVSSPSGTQSANVNIDVNAAPGLFSLFGTGTRDGAILNAITFLLGDFSTRTANSPTYLALFATGLNTSGTPVVTIGGVSVPVVFFGAAPCCLGLQQVNIMLTDSLAGAGRVPVVLTSAGGHSSNTVQVVLLPPAGSQQFSSDQENQTRSRELASLAYVPNSSLVLVSDMNDDVVRVVDVATKTVTHVVGLPSGANPDGIAVNAAGTTAVLTELGRRKVALIDLATFMVTAEITVGGGPVAVAIGGTQAVVVNQDDDTVSIIDLTSRTVVKTLAVGRGPKSVAVDALNRRAYVTNENDGTVSVIDLVTLTMLQTFNVSSSMRIEGIALLPGANTAFLTVPASGPNGIIVSLNLTTGATNSFAANPDRSGGSGDAVYFNGKVYLANQAGGSISVMPVNPATGAASGPITTIKVDFGARALAIDTKDNLLVVSNEGSGTLVLVSLSSGAVVGRIDAVRTSADDDDDHEDRQRATNLPGVQSLSPSSAKAGTTFTLTITGSQLTGATAVDFDSPGKKKSDDDFTVTNIQVSAGGTRLTATVKIDSSAKPGARKVQVTTPNGESADKGGATFVVNP